jgi:hypothetical protein
MPSKDDLDEANMFFSRWLVPGAVAAECRQHPTSERYKLKST